MQALALGLSINSWRAILVAALIALAAYLAVAYWVLPRLWRHYEHQRGLAGLTMVTLTAQGIPGDPINVGLVGSEEDVVRAFNSAEWFPADPITLRSSIAIVGSVLLHRQYRHAPVSPLFFVGRREDLAFERLVGGSARQRGHIRLWRVLDKGEEQRPVWLGSATFDQGIGLSHYTGAVTHRIAPDVDAQRDGLIGDLTRANMLQAIYLVSGIGSTLTGRNGEGDRYYTDGEVKVGRLVENGVAAAAPPQQSEIPQAVLLKLAIWRQIRDLIVD
jgi:LssY C-terminus